MTPEEAKMELAVIHSAVGCMPATATNHHGNREGQQQEENTAYVHAREKSGGGRKQGKHRRKISFEALTTGGTIKADFTDIDRHAPRCSNSVEGQTKFPASVELHTDAGFESNAEIREDVLERLTDWLQAVVGSQQPGTPLPSPARSEDSNQNMDWVYAVLKSHDQQQLSPSSTGTVAPKFTRTDLLALLQDGALLESITQAFAPHIATAAAVRQEESVGSGTIHTPLTIEPTRAEKLAGFFDVCTMLGIPKKYHFEEDDLLNAAGLGRVVRCLAMLENISRGNVLRKPGSNDFVGGGFASGSVRRRPRVNDTNNDRAETNNDACFLS